MKFRFGRLLTATALVVALMSTLAQAEQINANSDNIAIDGYDPVAYFTQAGPVPGLPEYSVEWQDTVWQFSSEEHQSMFEASPEKYAPRYGGFCAGAMSAKGVKSEIDPEVWVIVDGNLFLGGSPAAGYFEENAAAKIEQADKNWQALN